MRLSNQIFLAIVVGIGLGAVWPGAVPWVSWIGDVFILALKMLIAPLILASIVMGMASLGDVRRLGTMGGRTVAFYLCTTVLAVMLGLVVVNVVQPGRAGEISEPDAALVADLGKRIALQRLAPDRHAEVARVLAATLTEARDPKGEPVLPETSIERLREAYERRATTTLVSDTAAVSNLASSLLSAERFRLEVTAARGDAARDDDAKVQAAAAKDMSVGRFLRAQLRKLLQNPFQSLAEMNVLGIIVFALLLGAILTTLGERGEPLLRVFDALNEAMMRLVDLVMRLAPFGVGALMATQIAASGLGILKVLLWYMVAVLAGLLIHAGLVLPTILWAAGRVRPLTFLRQLRSAIAVAFSTCSSSATMPITIECLEKQAGVSRKVSGFVVPLGATINMDGTALYEAVAALFIAQVYGVELGVAEQILVALTATLAAIGAAGIPSAGTVTMVMVLSAVGLPLEGIGLILAVDRLLDMFRTATNVWGDAIGAAIVARLEGERPGAPPS